MLRLKRKIGQCFWVNKDVYVEVVDIKGGVAELGIVFPREYEVLRGELVDKPAPKEAVEPRVRRPLKTVLIGALTLMAVFVCENAYAEDKYDQLRNRTLICPTPEEYLDVQKRLVEAVANESLSIDDLSGTRCQWITQGRKVRLNHVDQKLFLVHVSISESHFEEEKTQGWVGLSEFEGAGNQE